MVNFDIRCNVVNKVATTVVATINCVLYLILHDTNIVTVEVDRQIKRLLVATTYKHYNTYNYKQPLAYGARIKLLELWQMPLEYKEKLCPATEPKDRGRVKISAESKPVCAVVSTPMG